MNLNNLLLFWSSFLLRTNGHGQPTVGWSAQSSSKLVFMLHLIIEGCRVADTDTWPQCTICNTTQCPSNVSTQCVHNVSKVRAVRSLDLRRICSANVNSKSAGHGAGVSFPVQIQPGDAGQGWTGSSPQLGSYLLSVGAAAALCNSIHSSTARRVQHCVHYKQQHHCAPCYAVPCASIMCRL